MAIWLLRRGKVSPPQRRGQAFEPNDVIADIGFQGGVSSAKMLKGIRVPLPVRLISLSAKIVKTGSWEGPDPHRNGRAMHSLRR